MVSACKNEMGLGKLVFTSRHFHCRFCCSFPFGETPPLFLNMGVFRGGARSGRKWIRQNRTNVRKCDSWSTRNGSCLFSLGFPLISIGGATGVLTETSSNNGVGCGWISLHNRILQIEKGQ